MPVAATPAERAALAVAAMTAFMAPFMGAAVNVALPRLAGDLRLDAAALGWVPTAYLLSAAVFLVPMGRLADIRGRKRVLAWGMVLYVLASELSALAPDGRWLIAARALHGVGAAMVFGTSVAVLTAVFPAERRGAALGINSAAVYLGLSLGPFVGGLMTERLGWRSVFHAGAAVGVVSGLVLLVLEDEWAEAPDEPFDWPGSVAYGVALTGIMYGLTRLADGAGAVSLLAGVAALVGFVVLEARRASPLLDIALFRGNRLFALSNLTALACHANTFAVGFLLSLYLQYTRGLSAEQAGLVLVSQPILMVLVSPWAGRVSDRVEPRVVASLGMAVILVGLVGLASLDATTSFGLVAAWLAVLGLGFGVFSSPNSNAIMGAVDRRSYGTAAATFATMRLTGQMLSMGLALLVLSSVNGPGRITAAEGAGVTASVHAACALFAILCALGIVASAARGRLRSPNLPGASIQ